ncbi:hypothetical protein J1614_008000 [Plenodomus biglobosus]|nr:hypothetical protein J1614_008000 [Plenodomus biglobosus]
MQFSPNAASFSPSGVNETQPKTIPAKQVSTPPSPYLEARILSLEESQVDLRGDVRSLKELYDELTLSLDKMKKGNRPMQFSSLEEVDPAESHQKALDFKAEFEKLESEVHMSVHGGADNAKANGMAAVKVNGSVPPHLRRSSVVNNGTITKSLPPHLRGAKKVDAGNGASSNHSFSNTHNDALITDGQVDGRLLPRPILSPPASPKTTVQDTTAAVEPLFLQSAWKPYYISTLPDLGADILSRIPGDDMVTFHPEFIQYTLKGETWSPGLRFMKGLGPHMLRNRTYYVLDRKNEPFLPSSPGKHGAKLTAFFKESPETFHADFEEDVSSYENVPMFIETKDVNGRFRYIYYGNYTQTRWSDKLDHDAMMTKVPESIKTYWAEELTSAARETWVTEALKKHFFPKPEYTGLLCAAHMNDDETSVATEVEVKYNATMARDVRIHVEALRQWDREAKMKTALIKKHFILDAFRASDVDEPPALRLWWEYLECVDWRKDFYDLLVALQSRNEQYLK